MTDLVTDPVTAFATDSPTDPQAVPVPAPLPALTVLGAPDILRRVEGRREECVDAVRRAYLAHDAGETANPHSAFLRFPDRPTARIISLPAYLGGETETAGIKWIASFPENTRHDLARASAVLLLNDIETGYPYACIESSIISATRTAASAVLGAETLIGSRTAGRIGIVGSGLIAGHVTRFLTDLGWAADGYRVFDLKRENAERFAAGLSSHSPEGTDVRAVDTVEEAFLDCDLVVLTTVAGEPHLHDPRLLAHNPVVLHLSLRDLAPELILASQNFTDDIDHAVRERTSLHLAEQQVGNRDFIDGTLADLLHGRVARDRTRPAVFSPFGLGVLDLAVGRWAYDGAVADGAGLTVSDFFQNAAR
ncbi:2,3-diaminopropionate biosynthesis protein SbnB [Streptomyces sp. NPDC059957]|uniref:2,3-diaminopropionate biosynthesis protein SbnB n=1 Tax=unclassified Streptomyces TaxID=2593676 RepID=UPI003652C2A8